MMGPLPKLYRLVMTGVSVAVFLAAGLWIGTRAEPLPLSLGAVLGVLAGVVVAWALVHDFHHRPRPLHLPRHR